MWITPDVYEPDIHHSEFLITHIPTQEPGEVFTTVTMVTTDRADLIRILRRTADWLERQGQPKDDAPALSKNYWKEKRETK